MTNVGKQVTADSIDCFNVDSPTRVATIGLGKPRTRTYNPGVVQPQWGEAAGRGTGARGFVMNSFVSGD